MGRRSGVISGFNKSHAAPPLQASPGWQRLYGL